MKDDQVHVLWSRWYRWQNSRLLGPFARARISQLRQIIRARQSYYKNQKGMTDEVAEQLALQDYKIRSREFMR